MSGFPGPEAMLDYGEQRLRKRTKLGPSPEASITPLASRRRLAVATVAARKPPERLDYDYLVSLKGIEPYAAAHCRMLLHDSSRLPIDSGVTAYLQERYGCYPAEFATSRSSWGPYLALGYRLFRQRDKLAASEPI